MGRLERQGACQRGRLGSSFHTRVEGPEEECPTGRPAARTRQGPCCGPNAGDAPGSPARVTRPERQLPFPTSLTLFRVSS